ncbi:hypothetical protein HanIR_Chr09g0409581 [Helianthus annuus]|nr:hypothetical protein HanIR_Chr09g0409581 [Helianthus annuus]
MLIFVTFIRFIFLFPLVCGRRLGFSMETQVQFPLVSYWGGYWAMMVTNPPRGVRS